jgi:hypothetical protein
MVAGIDLKRLAASPMGRDLAAHMKAGGMTGQMSMAGMDFLADVDRVFLSSTGTAPSRRGKKEEMRGVVALEGKFQPAKVKKFLTSKRLRRASGAGLELYTDPKDPAMVLAVAGPSVLLLGDRESVLEAVANRAVADPATASSAVYRRASELASQYEVFFVSEAPPGAIAGTKSKGLEMFEAVRGFEGGLRIGEALELALSLDAGSDPEAAKIATGAQALIQLALLGQQGDPELEKLVRKLKIGSAAGRVSLSVAWDRDEVASGLARMQQPAANPPAFAASRARTPVITAAKAAEPPPGPLVVRIHNADGGPTETKLSTPGAPRQ